MLLFKDEAPWLDYIVGHDEEGMCVLSESTPHDIKIMYDSHKEKGKYFRMKAYISFMIENDENPLDIFVLEDVKKVLEDIRIREDRKDKYIKFLNENGLRINLKIGL